MFNIPLVDQLQHYVIFRKSVSALEKILRWPAGVFHEHFLGAFQNEFSSGCSQIFFKIAILEKFAIFTGKHLCRSLFLIKLQALDLQLDLKKRIQHRCFPMNNAKFLITVFYRTTSVAASVNSKTLDPRLTTALCISVQGSNRCLGMNQTFTLTRFS